MALVRQKNSPFWYSALTLENKTYRKSLKTTNKKLALQLDEKHREELLKKIHLDGPEIKIAEAFEIYFRNKTKPCIFIPKWTQILNMDKNFSQLNQQDIQKLQDHLSKTLKPSSLSYNMAILKSVWRWARSQRYKVQELTFPKTVASKKRVRVMTLAQEDALLKALEKNKDCRDVAICLLDTGARKTEITDLKWSQVNLDAQEIELFRKKVGNTTILKMTKRMHRVLTGRYAYNPGTYVFEINGKPIGSSLTSIKSSLKKIGLKDWCIHDLRHSYAAKMLKAGLSIYDLQILLGHSSISTTEQYAFLCGTDTSKKAVQMIDDMNERNDRDGLAQFGVYFD
jgi:integrase